MASSEQMAQILRQDFIAINPYTFMGGEDCLSTIISLAKISGLSIDAGSWTTPIFLRGVHILSYVDLEIILDLIEEA